MSITVTQNFISHYNTQNDAFKYYPQKIPTVHTNLNERNSIEEGGSGPFIKTFVVEQDDGKIDDTRKVVGTPSTNTTFETGQIIFQIHVQENFGTKDSLAPEKIIAALKADFIGGYLTTSAGDFIKFGESVSRQPINIPKIGAVKGRGNTFEWFRYDLFIEYAY